MKLGWWLLVLGWPGLSAWTWINVSWKAGLLFAVWTLFVLAFSNKACRWDIETDGYVLSKYAAPDGKNRWRMGTRRKAPRKRPADDVAWIQPGELEH